MTAMRAVAVGAVAAALLAGAWALWRGSAVEPLAVPPSTEVRPVSPGASALEPIRGRVLDAQGHPLEGATVGHSQSVDSTARTDAKGQFTLPVLRDESMRVFAYAKGTATRRLAGVEPGARLELVVPPESRLTGVVRLEPHASPLLVSLCEPGDVEDPLCVARAVVRPERSRFDLRGLNSGAYQLTLERDGTRLVAESVTLHEGETLVLGTLDPGT